MRVVVVPSPTPGGGEAPNAEAPPIEAPPPAPPIAPELAAALDLVEPSRRPELAEAVPALAARWPAGNVERAIRQAAHALKKPGARPIRNLAYWVEGVLATWDREGKVTTSYPPAPAPAKSPERAAAELEAARESEAAKRAEKARAEGQAEAARRAEDAALRARWEALPAPERAEIEAQVRAKNPGLRRWKVMAEPLFFAAMRARSAVSP